MPETRYAPSPTYDKTCGHSVPYAGHPHLGDPIVETVVPSPPRSTRTTSHPTRLWLVRWSRVVYPLLESRPPHANSTPTPRPINQTRFRHTPPPSGQVSAALKARVRLCKLAGSHVPGTRLMGARLDCPVSTNTGLRAHDRVARVKCLPPMGSRRAPAPSS